MTKKQIKEEEKKKQNLTNDQIIKKLSKQLEGLEIINDEEIQFVSTGNLALDYISSGRFYNGGFPLGRITEIYGSSSSGKTVIGTHILQGVQQDGGIAVLLDSESAYSAQFGKILGLDISRLLYAQPESLEDCFKQIINTIEFVRKQSDDMRPIMIVYDSIAASPSKRELEKINKGEDLGSSMGHRALICSDYLRVIADKLNKLKAGVVVINQVREKVGVMYGPTTTTAGGGRSLEFYCSLRFNCRQKGHILDAKKNVIGINMNVANTKNKIFDPFRKADELELFFNKGISPTSGLIDLLKQQDKLKAGGGWLTIVDTEYKFQKSNIAQALLDNPDLIGFPDKESVQQYLDRNMTALESSNEENTVEEE